jgi:ParB family transcriptional regulator, chromosome partitioning protein
MSSKASILERMMGTAVSAGANHAGETVGVSAMHSAKRIAVERILPDPDQPRKTFDEQDLEDLASSLRDHGQSVPVQVRWDASRDRYLIIDGERRWRAAQRAGLSSLAVTVEAREMSADRILEMQIVENALRVDLTPLEAGRAYQTLMQLWGCNQTQLAQRLHISQPKVSRSLEALNLPADVQADVEQGKTGAMAAVKREREKAARRPKAKQTTTLTCPAGSAVITPTAGRTVVDVLLGLLEQEKKRGAA